MEEINVKPRVAAKFEQIYDEFKKLCTDEERIKCILSFMSDDVLVPEVHYDLKNDKKSEELRMQANRIFVSSPVTRTKCVDALKLYTQSIANAPCSSKQLAISYANRSAVLQKLRKYEEAIKDIDRALALPYPDNLKSKVYARRTACLECLQQQKLSDNIDKSKLPDELCPFKLKTYNIEIPCATDAISIKYSKDYGRHVVAARNIKIGETIVLEKAYSTMLSSKNLHTHCSHCLKVCWANIPCNSCTYAMYCSEECRVEEWEKYHDVECAVFPSLLNMDMGQENLFALRIAVQAVRQSSIDALRKELVEVDGHDDPRTKGFSKNGVFDSNQYRSLLSLVTNTEKLSVSDLTGKSVWSCFTLYFLATCTNMFGTPLENNWSLLRSNPDVTFFGGLLLRHEQMTPSNRHYSMELELDDLDVIERAVCALPFCSLLNHSCVQNVRRVSRNKEVAVIAIHPIKSGEQIFDTYGQFYELTPKADRQKHLEEQYKFICDCLPCRKDWPLYCNMKSYLASGRHGGDMIALVHALQKIHYHTKLILYERNVPDNRHVFFDLLAMVKVLYYKLPMQCREMKVVFDVVKRMYDLQGDTFELPLL